MKKIDRERQESIEVLRGILQPGDTVRTVLRHVSASGMSRRIDFYKIVDGETRFLTYHVARACGYKLSDKSGLTVGGCGMDMGFAVVYNLGSVLFPDGFSCIGDRCPSNDHSNREDNAWHRDGGYALRQAWI